MRLMLAGDLIAGRGIDQILPCPGDGAIDETWRGISHASAYVKLAVRRHGPLPRQRGFDYIWGDLLPVLHACKPDLRILNLECAVTTHPHPWPGKKIYLRMSPGNIPALTAGGIDCCSIANNHVMDWGREGLAETMASLKQAGIRFAGAGANLAAAEEPAVLQVEGMAGRVLFLAMATRDARVPAGWEATQAQSGINLIELDNQHLQRIASVVRRHRRTGDFVIASIHWGDNLSPRLEPETRRFAHLLIDRAGIDLIHGHSAHHVREIEVYRGKLILYGCGDLLNDYEGIDPYRGMRPYLGLVCLADIDPPSGRLRALNMIPTRVKRLRINRAGAEDTRWLLNTLNRRTAPLGLRVTARNGFLRLYGVGPA